MLNSLYSTLLTASSFKVNIHCSRFGTIRRTDRRRRAEQRERERERERERVRERERKREREREKKGEKSWTEVEKDRNTAKYISLSITHTEAWQQ